MTSQSLHRSFLLPLLGAFFLSSISLHAQNELVPAPNAVKLRRVWTLQGDIVKGGQQIGKGVAPLFDIDADGANEFAVYRGDSSTWMFFKGGNPPRTFPFLHLDSVMSSIPVVGDFWGNGLTTMICMKARVEGLDSVPSFFYKPHVYILSQATIEEVPITAQEHRCFIGIKGVELDGNPGEEVVLLRGCPRREVVIYQGGSGFTLDSPTVVIYDAEDVDYWNVYFGDFDGDSHIDMITGGDYPGRGTLLKFWWGDANSPYSWAERAPDRELTLVQGVIGINSIVGLNIADYNGDSALDIASQEYADAAGVRIYLTNPGKDIRTRTFDLNDADVFYNGENLSLSPWPMGYMNDSTRHYAMLPVGGYVGANQTARLAVSGNSHGPNQSYEAWYAPGEDGLSNQFVFNVGAAIGDATGDGWEDVLYGSVNYGRAQSGLAFILAGGPYIPFDDTTVSVVEYPVAGESGGLYLWPNPVVDELHIAWKGNLKRMPARFVVYDLNGKEVVAGDVRPHLGAALWRCGSVPAGTYVVAAFDANGKTIASARVVKQ